MALVHRPGLLAARILIALLASTGLAACAAEEERSSPVRESTPAPPALRAQREDPDTIVPPVPNGEPMPPAEEAGGIPPYPGATVWMASRAPSSNHRVTAFTPDPWDRVSAFYQESLPGWRMIRTKDVVVFQKEPDQAAVTVSPWGSADAPRNAPEVLRSARTAIGIAWR